MNRRGDDSQEWITNDGIIKLLAGVAILIFLIYFGFKLFAMFSNPEGVQAQKNFDLLIERINYIHDNKITGVQASLLYKLPEKLFYVIGFDAGDAGKTINFEKDGTTVALDSITRPSSCSDKSACLCLAKAGQTTPKYISCKNIPYATASMKTGIGLLFSDASFFSWGQSGTLALTKKQDGTYPVFLANQVCSTCGPTSIIDMNFITQTPNNILLSLDNLK